jgi:RecA-family ATPase
MIHHKITRQEVAGWLFYSAMRREDGKLMMLDDKGRVIEGDLASALENTVAELKADVVSLDPFIKTHAVPENSNDAIDAVAQLLTDMSHKHNLAVDTPHHVSKGTPDPGNPQKGRGASAAVDAGRLIYTLTPMSENEDGKTGLPRRSAPRGRVRAVCECRETTQVTAHV